MSAQYALHTLHVSSSHSWEGELSQTEDGWGKWKYLRIHLFGESMLGKSYSYYLSWGPSFLEEYRLRLFVNEKDE